MNRVELTKPIAYGLENGTGSQGDGQTADGQTEMLNRGDARTCELDKLLRE